MASQEYHFPERKMIDLRQVYAYKQSLLWLNRDVLKFEVTCLEDALGSLNFQTDRL